MSCNFLFMCCFWFWRSVHVCTISSCVLLCNLCLMHTVVWIRSPQKTTFQLQIELFVVDLLPKDILFGNCFTGNLHWSFCFLFIFSWSLIEVIWDYWYFALCHMFSPLFMLQTFIIRLKSVVSLLDVCFSKFQTLNKSLVIHVVRVKLLSTRKSCICTSGPFLILSGTFLSYTLIDSPCSSCFVSNISQPVFGAFGPRTTHICLFPAGAKSTENLNRDPGVDDEFDGGFRTLSPTPLVPRGERARGRMSPGSEMLTLEQFLKEANKDADINASPKDTVSSLYCMISVVMGVHLKLGWGDCCPM